MLRKKRAQRRFTKVRSSWAGVISQVVQCKVSLAVMINCYLTCYQDSGSASPNVLYCSLLNNMAQLLSSFGHNTRQCTVEKEDKAHAHSTLFKYFHPEPLPSPITKDIKSMATCCHFPLHSRRGGLRCSGDFEGWYHVRRKSLYHFSRSYGDPERCLSAYS